MMVIRFGGLSSYDGEAWRYFGLREGLADPYVYDIAVAPSGDLWLATPKGTTRFDVELEYGFSYTTTTSALAKCSYMII